MLARRALWAFFLLAACSSSRRDPFAPEADASAPAVMVDAGAAAVDERDGGELAKGDAGGAIAASDPAEDGPFETSEKAGSFKVTATGDTVAMHAFFPKDGGPQPVVVFAHGFQIAASSYEGYLKRLASFGFVALTADFPAALTGGDNTEQANDLLGGIDWAKSDSTIAPHADVANVGMTGHSLGGKLALLAATIDDRVKAAIVLDPVDGGGGPGGCSEPECVVVAGRLPELGIPTAFLGETRDAQAGFGGQACAPAASNYTTFFAKARSPSVEVTVLGASHPSFVDDIDACGFACSACKAATSPHEQVQGIARAYVTAFFERWLRGRVEYDAYLTGAAAKDRYVTTNQIKLRSK